jgi:hypothetical protein
MCRNIKPLFNFDPQATDADIREASIQFVRKISGMNKASTVNSFVFEQAVDEMSASAKKLFNGLATDSKPKNREVEAVRAKARSAKRFGANG